MKAFLVSFFIPGIILGIWFIFSEEIDFFFSTRILMPFSREEVRYESNILGMGDGEEETSFKISSSDMESILNKKPFGQNWEKGPYSGLSGDLLVGDLVNILEGSHQIINGPNLFYAFKYKNPEAGDFDKSNLLLVLDTENKILLFREENF